MKYIRTSDKIITDDFEHLAELSANDYSKYFHYDLQEADNIEDLIMVGDLVKYYDKTRHGETYAEIDEFFAPQHTIIYRVVELYIKQSNGDFKLVAKEKGNYKLELV